MLFKSARFTMALLALAHPTQAQPSRTASPALGLRLPRLFSDGVVLQRDRPITLWGWTGPGSNVVAQLGLSSAHARSDAQGSWTLALAARPAGGPFRLVVRTGTDSVVVSNVLIGDVWVASGQSNMEFQVASAANAARALAEANDSTIRQFKVPNSWSLSPEEDLAGGSWAPGDREHVGAFSAVAYFFVRHLRPNVGVPIGIINSTWGGSNIETWISREAQHLSDSAWAAIQQGEAAHDRAVRDSLRAKAGATLPDVDSGLVNGAARWADPALDDHSWDDIRVPGYWEGQGYPGLDGIAWYRTAVTLGTDGQHINKIPSVLYNKMIRPILPLAIKGVLWYQGESNANNVQQAVAYQAQFRTLIQSWRHDWNGGRASFPFLWVQLPGFGRPDDVPQLHPAWAIQRESMDAALNLTRTGRAVAIDLGEANDIHPKNKEDVGARLALVGRRVAYGEPVDASGPVYRGFTVRADTAIVSFSPIAGGLKIHGDRLAGFALAGADEQFVWANARVVGDRVYVWSDRVAAPRAVRYAWTNNPEAANLFGANGLPAAPFRSDRW